VVDSGVGYPRSLPRLFPTILSVDEVGDICLPDPGWIVDRCQVVEQHHGNILVESEPGKGSTFTVQLTRQDPHFSGAYLIEKKRRLGACVSQPRFIIGCFANPSETHPGLC
jgi:hypothetical protein